MSLTFKITNRLLIILFIFFSHTSLGITETLFKVKSITSLATEMNRTVNISSTSEAYRKIQIQSEITSKIKKVLKTKGSLIKENEVIIKLEEYDSYKKLFDNGLISKNEFNKIALLTPFEGILLDGHKIEGELITPGSVVYEIIDLSLIHI